MLDSALIKNEDIHLPRLRRRSETHDTSRSPEQIQKEILSDLEQELVRQVSEVPEVLVPEVLVPEVPLKKKRGRPKKIRDLTTPEVQLPKRPRGRPKGSTIKKPVLTEEESISWRRLKRKRTPIPIEFMEHSDLDSIQEEDYIGPPIPLTKRQTNEQQKPLKIDIDRLVIENNRDKRSRINTLDVLKHLVKRFEPPVKTGGNLNYSIINDDFKLHLIDYLNHLSDIHGNISDLSTEVKIVQRERDEIRKNMLQTRKDYADVINETNKIRHDFQKYKEKHEDMMDLNQQLQNLRHSIDTTTENPISTIDENLGVIHKLYNKANGLGKNLKLVNQNLRNIDDQL